MAVFAQWLGYFVMALGAVAVAAGLLGGAVLLLWQQLKRARGLVRIVDAVRSADRRVEETQYAARYRWLRNESYWSGSAASARPWVVIGTTCDDATPLMPGEMDNAIDAAIAANKGEK